MMSLQIFSQRKVIIHLFNGNSENHKMVTHFNAYQGIMKMVTHFNAYQGIMKRIDQHQITTELT